MSANELKKMIIFSSKSNKRMVEQMLSDEANVSNRSVSALTEKYLIDSLLPMNKTAATLVKSLYDEETQIKEVLCYYF